MTHRRRRRPPRLGHVAGRHEPFVPGGVVHGRPQCVFLSLRDGRVNVPDVFRVGYGLGRRGGVKPVR